MEERAIHISSINREKLGQNRPVDFIIKFNPPLNLNPDKKHSLAIDRLHIIYFISILVSFCQPTE